MRLLDSTLLGINSIFGPPIGVRNEIFSIAIQKARAGELQPDWRYWVMQELRSRGYFPCKDHELVWENRYKFLRLY